MQDCEQSSKAEAEHTTC